MGSATSNHKDHNLMDIYCVGILPKAHKSQIRFLTITPNNKYLISAGDDLSISVYSISTKRKICEFKHFHTGKITSLSISQNGAYLVSTSQDMSIKLYNLQKMQVLHSFQLIKQSPSDRITCATFTSDCKFIIAGAFDGGITMFSITRRQKYRSIPCAHNSSITTLQVTSDNRLLISASLDKSIQIFHLKRFKKITSIHHMVKGQTLCSNEIILVEDPTKFISMGDYSLLEVDLTKHQSFPIIENSLNKLNCIAVSKDFKYLFLLVNGESIHIYNFQLHTKLFEMIEPNIQCFTVSSKGELIILGYTDGSIKLFKNPILC